jgi:hypothetical protein
MKYRRAEKESEDGGAKVRVKLNPKRNKLPSKRESGELFSRENNRIWKKSNVAAAEITKSQRGKK